MRGGFSKDLRGRAIIALFAFYAFFLQTLLAAATPCPPPDLVDVICTSHGPATPAHGGQPAHDHECCTALHVGEIVPIPPIAYDTLPVARPVEIAFVSVHKRAPKTSPPTAAHGARSPPAV